MEWMQVHIYSCACVFISLITLLSGNPGLQTLLKCVIHNSLSFIIFKTQIWMTELKWAYKWNTTLDKRQQAPKLPIALHLIVTSIVFRHTLLFYETCKFL